MQAGEISLLLLGACSSEKVALGTDSVLLARSGGIVFALREVWGGHSHREVLWVRLFSWSTKHR